MENPPKTKKRVDHSYKADFRYTQSENPYSEKLGEFDQFVLCDHDTELYKGKWNSEVFDNSAILNVEIGCGNGSFMIDYCMAHPDENFIGLDFRFKRSFFLAKRLGQLPHKNFRYLRAKGERLEFMFAENEIDNLFYFFPDPWPKKRHHKKRLFQRPFLEAVFKVLKSTGTFYIKTDHDDYAQWMIEEMNQASDLFSVSLSTLDLKKEHPDHFLSSFTTQFEKIFLKDGILIKAFVIKPKK